MNSLIGASGCAPKCKAIVATKYMATVYACYVDPAGI